jgi:hypothetical protein
MLNLFNEDAEYGNWKLTKAGVMEYKIGKLSSFVEQEDRINEYNVGIRERTRKKIHSVCN